MRLAGPDVVLFVVGFVLFSGSVYGLMQMDGLEGGGSALGIYQIAWTESPEDVDLGAFDSQPSFEFAFDVVAADVGTVIVAIDCARAAPAPGVTTSIAVEVTGPAGQSGQATGACGAPVTVEIPIFPPPQGGVVEGSSASNAEEAAAAGLDGSAAVGAWSGSASFSSQAGAVGTPTLVQYSGTATATLVRYTPQATAASPR